MQGQSNKSIDSVVNLSQASLSSLSPKNQDPQVQKLEAAGRFPIHALGILLLFEDDCRQVQGQVIGAALQISRDVIITTSLFKLNLSKRAAIFYCPNQKLGIIGLEKREQKKYRIRTWLFAGTLEQAQPLSNILALGLLEEENLLNEYGTILSKCLSQKQKDVSLFGYRESFGSQFNQLEGYGIKIDNKNYGVVSNSAEINQITDQYIQYRTDFDKSKQEHVLAGSPIYVSTHKGLRIVGLHMGKSVKFQGGAYGILLASQMLAAIEQLISSMQKVKEKKQHQSMLQNQVSKQVQLFKFLRLHHNFGKYLFRTIKRKKVQLLFKPQEIAIKVYDQERQTILYARLSQAQLQGSGQIIDTPLQLFRTLESEIQRQNQDYGRIFSYRQGVMSIKLQEKPQPITIETEARCSTIVSKIQPQKNSAKQLQSRLKMIARDHINDMNFAFRSQKERIDLKFSQLVKKLQLLLEKAVKRTEATFDKLAEKMVEEFRNSIAQKVKAELNIHRLQFFNQQIIAEMKDRSKKLAEMIVEQKQQISQLAFSVLRMERQTQYALQDLKIRFEGSQFTNQMNFARLEEVNQNLRVRLKEIAEVETKPFPFISELARQSKISDSYQKTFDLDSPSKSQSKVYVIGVEKVIDKGGID